MTHEVLVSILQFPENLGVIQEALARVVFLDLEMDLEVWQDLGPNRVTLDSRGATTR